MLGGLISSRVSLPLLLSALLPAASLPALGDPDFRTFRWDEDYRYLGGDSFRPDLWQRMKFTPVGLAGLQGYVSFGGSLRSRVNVYNNDRFGLQGGRDGEQWLQRFYGHVDLHIGERFRVYLELSADYAKATGDLAPGPFDKDKGDVGQAFVDWQSGASRWRVGRQEMSLGSARFMGTRDASNVRRSYDGLRWDIDSANVQGRAFYLQLVEVERGMFDDSSHHNDSVWGLSSTWGPDSGKADVYYLGLRREDVLYVQGVANETRHSFGVRLFGAREDWDWNIEGLYQIGDFGNDDIRAWTLASIVGYRLPGLRGQPRLALSANVASGDSDPDDNRLETFNPVFPNLAYFEEAAIYAPQNFYNIEPEISWSVSTRLRVSLDWNFFWRLEGNDAVYVRGLLPLPNTAGQPGDFVAHSPSLSVDVQWNRYLSFDLSYSHFFAQQVIDHAGGGDVDFFKVQVEWKL